MPRCDNCGEKVKEDELNGNVDDGESEICGDCAKDIPWCHGGCDQFKLEHGKAALPYECVFCEGDICKNPECGMLTMDAQSVKAVFCGLDCPMITAEHKCATCKGVFLQVLGKSGKHYKCLDCIDAVGAKRKSPPPRDASVSASPVRSVRSRHTTASS